MSKNVYILCLITLGLICGQCRKDFIVEDISAKRITVNGPADKLITPVNLVTFWWEPLEGAEGYNLQVVKPSFQNVAQLVFDTNLIANKFNVILQPGTYQWRIRAFNAGHTTPYQLFNIQIDTSSNLNAQSVNPVSPLSGHVTGKNIVKLTWQPVFSALEYQVMINDGAVTNTKTAETSLTFTLPVVQNSNNVFSWKVKAINGFGSTSFSAVQSFTVDKLPPLLSLPLSPLSSSLYSPNLTAQDTLKWTKSQVINPLLDVKFDSIYVATDSLFTIQSLKVQNRVNKAFVSIGQLSPSLPPSNMISPYYYWRLTSTDSMGNRSSAASSYYKFKLLP